VDTIAFLRLHKFDAVPELVINTIAQYVDAFYVLFHNIIDISILDLAINHEKCQGIREWKKPFNNLSQLDFCLEWANQIKPQYVLEFDEDELPPDRFHEEFKKFKDSGLLTMWFWGLWCIDDTNKVLAEHRPQYFWHQKAYRWMPNLVNKKRGGFNSFQGNHFKSKFSYLCKYPLRHLAFLTPELRERRIITGNSKGHSYEKPWFNRKGLKFVPYDKNMTVKNWKEIINKYN
jgi:hypothetical protein